jgi:hypothetical protein
MCNGPVFGYLRNARIFQIVSLTTAVFVTLLTGAPPQSIFLAYFG